jgi:hypothetical protein
MLQKEPGVKSFGYFLLVASAVALYIHIRHHDLPYFFGRSKAELPTPPPSGEIVVAKDHDGALTGRWPTSTPEASPKR